MPYVANDGARSTKEALAVVEDTSYIEQEARQVGKLLSEVEPERVTWLWDKRIPKGS